MGWGLQCEVWVTVWGGVTVLGEGDSVVGVIVWVVKVLGEVTVWGGVTVGWVLQCDVG